MENNIKTAMASLVSSGTITQAQSDKVVQAYTQSFANRQQNSQQGSGQQGSGYQQGSGQGQNPILTQLVSNGTLTQSQADAVNQAIRKTMPNHRTGGSTSGPTTTQ
jgi:polyhydroxyalkanoate synthesis regulator phasin